MKYSAYNLIIESELPLPLPVDESGTPADIVITIGKIDEPENLCRTYDGVWYAHGEESLFLKWDIIGSFLIYKGQNIVIEPQKSELASPVVPLLGTVMAVAMQQKNLSALHGSSVIIGDVAIVFLGGKGEGKSTIAAYLQKQGHTLLSDDVCAIDMNAQSAPLIAPSFSKIKLWPDSIDFLEDNAENYEKVHPLFEKRSILLDSNGFCSSPSPVVAIIELATGSDIKLERLAGHSAIPSLISHFIINRFPEEQPVDLMRNVYSQVTKLLQRTSTYRLTRPRDIALVPETGRVVIEFFRKKGNK